MSCPACGCKETYQFDDWGDDFGACADDRMERCAACGAVFDIDDHAPEDDDHEGAPHTPEIKP